MKRIAKEKKKLEAERLKQQEMQEKLIEEEAEKLAKEKELELQEIYRKQLEAMEKANSKEDKTEE